MALMCKRVYDAAGNIGKNTKIFLNGERLKVKGVFSLKNEKHQQFYSRLEDLTKKKDIDEKN